MEEPQRQIGKTHMGRSSSRFRQQDVTRALRATRAAGIEVERIEIEKDKIVVVTGKTSEAPSSDENKGNEWDDLR